MSASMGRRFLFARGKIAGAMNFQAQAPPTFSLLPFGLSPPFTPLSESEFQILGLFLFDF